MQHVICQEIGHTLGLDHTSEDGSSQNTCMDYYHNTSASDTKSTHPNAHDNEELTDIYRHLDSTSTVGGSAGFLPDAVPSFARQRGESLEVRPGPRQRAAARHLGLLGAIDGRHQVPGTDMSGARHRFHTMRNA